MTKMLRDEIGRFTEAEPSPEIARQIREDNLLGPLVRELAGKLGLEQSKFGATQLESGNWIIAFAGLAPTLIALRILTLLKGSIVDGTPETVWLKEQLRKISTAV